MIGYFPSGFLAQKKKMFFFPIKMFWSVFWSQEICFFLPYVMTDSLFYKSYDSDDEVFDTIEEPLKSTENMNWETFNNRGNTSLLNNNKICPYNLHSYYQRTCLDIIS